jgi:hypothetical protein
MEKLNRLVWEAGLSFNAFGVRIGVRVNTQELLQRAAPFADSHVLNFSPALRTLDPFEIGVMVNPHLQQVLPSAARTFP